MFANFYCGVHEFCYRISLIYKCCREILIGVAVVVLCCLRKFLLLCLLNDVVVTFVGHRTSLSSPNPHSYSPRTSTHPPSSRRDFRSLKTKNTGGEYLYNTGNCFLRFLFTNEKTEVKLLFFVSCTKLKRKKPKNGSRIAFSGIIVQDQKEEKTEVELLFPFFVHGEKKLMKRK